jgi:hypothetical protein
MSYFELFSRHFSAGTEENSKKPAWVVSVTFKVQSGYFPNKNQNCYCLNFMKGMSIQNATFKLTDSILKSINKKMHFGGIFCDLAKAFDRVYCKILLTKLQFYGIQGVTGNWFRSYLTDRKQKIK